MPTRSSEIPDSQATLLCAGCYTHETPTGIRVYDASDPEGALSVLAIDPHTATPTMSKAAHYVSEPACLTFLAPPFLAPPFLAMPFLAPPLLAMPQ